jgi:hypothetical protein
MKTRAQYFKRRVVLYSVVFLNSFVMVATVWAIYGDWMKYFRLSRSGKWTEGKRIGVDKIQVENWVGENGLITQSSIVSIEVNSSIDNIDTTVPVIYLPSNPKIACACNPVEALRDATYAVAIWSSLIALLLTFGYHHFRMDYWE